MTTELAKTNDERPSFLAERKIVGVEGMASKVRPSFMKLVQKQSSDELIDKFGSGSIILTPDGELVCKSDEVTAFVPLFYYIEYCKWAPLALKGTEPMIAERSFDPKSEVAIKAQSPATWTEDHPNYPGSEKHQYKYREHINFIVKLMDPEHAHREPVLLSFSKTNYVNGQRLLKLILQRRASIFAGIYDLGTRIREGQENNWRVYTVDCCKSGSWVTDPNMVDEFEKAHDYYAELQRSRQLDTAYDDEAVEETAEAGDGNGTDDEIPY